jgi:hypothetical protein
MSNLAAEDEPCERRLLELSVTGDGQVGHGSSLTSESARGRKYVTRATFIVAM